MENNYKQSKVAICPNCKKFVMAAEIGYISKATEEEFTELINEGFEVKLETKEETQKRELGTYAICWNKKCKKNE